MEQETKQYVDSFEYIIESHHNGQFRQMHELVNNYGLKDFARELSNQEFEDDVKYEILYAAIGE